MQIHPYKQLHRFARQIASLSRYYSNSRSLSSIEPSISCLHNIKCSEAWCNHVAIEFPFNKTEKTHKTIQPDSQTGKHVNFAHSFVSFAGISLFNATLLQVYFRKYKSALDWQLRLEWTFDKVLAACCQLMIVLNQLQNSWVFGWVSLLNTTNNMSKIDLNLLKLLVAIYNWDIL